MGNYRLTRRGKIVLMIFIILVFFLIYFAFSTLYEKKNPIEDVLMEPNEINTGISEDPDDLIIHNEEELKYSIDEIETLRNSRTVVYFLPDHPDLIKDEELKINDFPLFEENIVIEGNINGYPDFQDTDFGIWLGNERAERIKVYLINTGFSKERIKIINNGSSKPINKDGTPNELQKNRRVEVYYEYN